MKRCEQTGRTVIGPDPTLRLSQVAVPPQFAKNLTKREYVNKYNIEKLTKLVNDGKANFIWTTKTLKDGSTKRVHLNLKWALYNKGTELLYGDLVIRKYGEEVEVKEDKVVLQQGDQVMRNGEFLDVKYPTRKKITLKLGDIVERHLHNGDILILNRQPTLHKGGMLGKEVVVRSGKTLRINLASCKSFNADFDFSADF